MSEQEEKVFVVIDGKRMTWREKWRLSWLLGRRKTVKIDMKEPYIGFKNEKGEKLELE